MPRATLLSVHRRHGSGPRHDQGRAWTARPTICPSTVRGVMYRLKMVPTTIVMIVSHAHPTPSLPTPSSMKLLSPNAELLSPNPRRAR